MKDIRFYWIILVGVIIIGWIYMLVKLLCRCQNNETGRSQNQYSQNQRSVNQNSQNRHSQNQYSLNQSQIASGSTLQLGRQLFRVVTIQNVNLGGLETTPARMGNVVAEEDDPPSYDSVVQEDNARLIRIN